MKLNLYLPARLATPASPHEVRRCQEVTPQHLRSIYARRRQRFNAEHLRINSKSKNHPIYTLRQSHRNVESRNWFTLS